MSGNPIYYKPSGKFEVKGIVLLLITLIPAALLASFVYTLATAFIPFVYVNVLLTLGLGMSLGNLLEIMAGKAKIRNRSLVNLAGMLVTLIVIYANWVFYLNSISEASLYVFAPGELLRGAESLGARGSWSIRSFTPSGPLLYAVWGIEAFLVAYMIMSKALKFGGELFCEDCFEWVTGEKKISKFALPEDYKGFVSELESGNLGALANLEKTKDIQFAQIRVARCSVCEKKSWLSVFRIVNSKEFRSEKPILSNLIINPDQYKQIAEMK